MDQWPKTKPRAAGATPRILTSRWTLLPGRRVLLIAVAVLLGSVAVGGRCHAQAVGQTVVINREYTIKAAFLYHFLTYTEWPKARDPGKLYPIVLGVYGTDPFGAVLDKIASTKKVGGRPIKVRRIAKLSDIDGCHLLFVPGTVPKAIQESLLKATASRPVLLVGESDGFVDNGGGAQFFLEGNKVRFAFNTDVVQERKLKVSSKLLALAKIVSTAQSKR